MVINETYAIEVENLAISYFSFERGNSISLGKYKEIEALKEINLKISPGESVAILGKNGAGKTTLLQAISGSLRPKYGRIQTNGKVFTLRGSNPGLIPHLTPRQNVRLLAPVYGVSKDKLKDFEDEVEKFCELGEAYDRRYKTLSSGMAGRVGFGFTTSLSPEILLMDETLGVGDENFRKKATKKSEEFMKKGETLLLSTHSLNLAKSMCMRGIVLDAGQIVFDGKSSEAVEFYLKISK